jgi:prefoldin subunit 5|tara:strand:- start:45 stop:227 length:183 start_codon:yes stop_codon:yes gene_type:complete
MMGQKEEDMLRKNIYLMQEQIQNAYKRIDSLVEENRKLKKDKYPDKSFGDSWVTKPEDKK